MALRVTARRAQRGRVVTYVRVGTVDPDGAVDEAAVARGVFAHGHRALGDARLLREAQTLARVSHPNVDGGHPADVCFLTAAPHPGSSSFRNTVSLDQHMAEQIGTLFSADSLAGAAIADADPYPYWYDDVDEPDSNPTLVRTESCDLCVIGGGYNGLWTAIIAKERDPNRDVILIDAHEVGSQASGRNGGFMESSLTHGVANGLDALLDVAAELKRRGEHRVKLAFIGDGKEKERLAARAAELGQKSGLPEEVVQQVLNGVDDPGRFADLVADAGLVEAAHAAAEVMLDAHPDAVKRHLDRWLGGREELLRS